LNPNPSTAPIKEFTFGVKVKMNRPLPPRLNPAKKEILHS